MRLHLASNATALTLDYNQRLFHGLPHQFRFLPKQMIDTWRKMAVFSIE